MVPKHHQPSGRKVEFKSIAAKSAECLKEAPWDAPTSRCRDAGLSHQSFTCQHPVPKDVGDEVVNRQSKFKFSVSSIPADNSGSLARGSDRLSTKVFRSSIQIKSSQVIGRSVDRLLPTNLHAYLAHHHPGSRISTRSRTQPSINRPLPTTPTQN